MTHQEIGSTYRETGAAGAKQLELVVLLYGALLDDLRRSIQSIRARNIETRTFELQHALRILEQLQGSLNMDEGGEVAANLEHLYSYVRAKIIEAQWKVSEDILQSQIDLLAPIRDAWKQAFLQQEALQGTEPHLPAEQDHSTFECRT
jgi:flagellar secretion chaperone FliS